MMINQLSIAQFRGIQEGKLEDLGKINMLIGPNNSGKTTVLDMLYLTAASGYDFLGLNPRIRLLGKHGKLPPANLKPNNGLRVLFFDAQTSQENFQKRFFDEYYYMVPDWNRQIATAMANVYPEMAGCRVEMVPAESNKRTGAIETMTGAIEIPGTAPRIIDDFGSGTRHAFKVITGLIALKELVSDDEPGLFLWDGPESFMHPSAIGLLLKEVVNLIEKAPIQVFISTQSNDVIAELTLIADKSDALKEDFRAFRLGIQDGRLFSAAFRTENLVAWLSSGKDPSSWGTSNAALSYCLNT